MPRATEAGSLRDEFERGVRTPVLEHSREDILSSAGRDGELHDFVLSPGRWPGWSPWSPRRAPNRSRRASGGRA